MSMKALFDQSPELTETYTGYKALYAHGRYAEAEMLVNKALELGKCEFGADHPHVGVFLDNLALCRVSVAKSQLALR